jgi:hypothetical protein
MSNICASLIQWCKSWEAWLVKIIYSVLPIELKSHYHVQKRPPLVIILSQVNPVCIFISYSIKINFNIILQVLLGLPSCFLLCSFQIKVLYWFSFLLMRVTGSRLVLGPTQPPMHWALEIIYTGLKRQDREAGHSPLSSAEDESGEVTLPLSHSYSWRGV